MKDRQISTHDIIPADIQQLLYSALDASISGIIITDNQLDDNPIIYCNDAFLKISGYDREQIIGNNCRFLQGDDREQEERTRLREAIKQGNSINIEIRNYRKNGNLFWNDLYISPIKDKDSNITHFVGVQNDVTRRKIAQLELQTERVQVEQKVKERTEKLQLSEEYLNSIIQTVRESLVVLDPSLKVLTVNKEFLHTFKVNESGTVGKLLFDLGNRQWDIKPLRDLLEKILPSNNPVLGFEMEHNFPNIGQKLMLLNAYQIKLGGEYKDRIVLAIEDITEKRAIEQRKDDFLSIASHELKTPLTTLKGYLHVLDRFLEQGNRDRVAEIVEKAKTQVDRLDSLIVELLDVSKIQSGKLDLHRSTFDFDKMVSDTVHGVQVASSKHKIEIMGSVGISCYGDEPHLSQVLSNLLVNAMKYSPDEDKVILYLSVVGRYIKLSVRDFGIGISLSDQKKIFERFYRVQGIQKRYPGMGIGLYICDQIVKQHGGNLWVDSELNNGSTFSITLPIKTKEENV